MQSTAQTPWLVSRRYDLAFITFSAALLFLPHFVHQLTSSTIAVDIAISLLIGGPHLFATYTMTFMEPRFRQRYPRYTWGALAMPLIVLVLAIVHLDLLVTMFFFFAALHVIHQAGYVADSYRAKAGAQSGDCWTRIGTLTDYGLLAASLFVLATFRFTGTSLQVFGRDLGTQAFTTGGRVLLFPGLLRSEALAWMALALFALFALAFVVVSVIEAAKRRLNGPKTLHMAVAASLFFLTPALQNLDVAFQGLNTWHSFQYLALVLFLNRYRESAGLIGSPFVARLSQRGPRLYLLCFAFTAAAGATYLAIRGITLLLDVWPGDVSQHHYFAFYVSMLSCLLIHYYFDHFLFLQVDDVVTPRWSRVGVAA